MSFATPMTLFDRDFPGDYLRLIRQVRVSLLALLPPPQEIRATLSTTGTARTVLGGPVFQAVRMNYGPQSVALSSPRDATGVFELQAPSDLRLPFEGLGVDTSWELRMPRASNLFDYTTIADVLVTIDYTALHSPDYRQQVVRDLDRRFTADRSFSFRHQFADPWYDLHHPDRTATPMQVRFRTERADFPPGLEALKIQHVLLYVVAAAGRTFEAPPVQLRFAEQGAGSFVGGEAVPTDRVVSTRRGNAGSWTSMVGRAPAGEWELSLPDTAEVRRRFGAGDIEDILFVITYSGLAPEWPA
jgi:Tc toxin complex TcA C-terminal TcB-binding domain